MLIDIRTDAMVTVLFWFVLFTVTVILLQKSSYKYGYQHKYYSEIFAIGLVNFNWFSEFTNIHFVYDYNIAPPLKMT